MNKTYTKSNKWLDRAKSTTPSGAQTYSKSARYYCEGAGPAVLSSGKGSKVLDVDGHEYIDLILGLGAVTLGHCDTDVDTAMRAQIDQGIAYSLANTTEIKLCEKLCEIIPCAEMVRLVKNGTDATSASIRLARAFTNRNHIALCGYHGWQDWSIATTESNRGIPESTQRLSHRFIYNDLGSLKKLFQEFPEQIAAVIIEPANQIIPDSGYLQSVKNLTHEQGALLIFDEVVSGFRMALGGGQEYFNVIPDLACFGKGMANGSSISALVGKKEFMELIDQGVFISMTHGGEAVSASAALATINKLEKSGAIQHAWEIGKQLHDGLKQIATAQKLDEIIDFKGYACHPGIHFRDSKNLTKNDLFAVFQQSMLDQGVIMLAVQNFCLAHSSADIEFVLSCAEKALFNVTQAINNNSTEGLLRGSSFKPVFQRN